MKRDDKADKDKPGLNWKHHSTLTAGSAVANISEAENADGARMYSVCFQRQGRAGATRYFRLGDLESLLQVVADVRQRFSENAQKAEEQRQASRRTRG